jgi:uncharacterized protein (TIGR02118 family)
LLWLWLTPKGPPDTVALPIKPYLGVGNKEVSMAKLFAIYQQPADPAAFDRHYLDTHVPLVKKIPGLRSYEVTRGDVMGMGGKHAVYLVAARGFDSMAAVAAGMGSAEGQATAADLANFAQAGVDVMMADSEMI